MATQTEQQTERQKQTAWKQSADFWGSDISSGERLERVKNMTELGAARALASGGEGLQAIVIVALKSRLNHFKRERQGK